MSDTHGHTVIPGVKVNPTTPNPSTLTGGGVPVVLDSRTIELLEGWRGLTRYLLEEAEDNDALRSEVWELADRILQRLDAQLPTVEVTS
jgi:hypothetical protein